MRMMIVFIGAFVLAFFGLAAFAQEIHAVLTPAPEIPVNDFLTQVMLAVKEFGGLTWGLKVGLICNLLVASSKVSAIRPFTWDKIPLSTRVFVAPLLAIIGGLVALGKFDLPSLAAWAMAGGGAILLDQLLAALKEAPWVGEKYKAFIVFVSQLLRKPGAKSEVAK